MGGGPLTPGPVIDSVTDIVCGLAKPKAVIVIAPVYTPGRQLRGIHDDDKCDGRDPGSRTLKRRGRIGPGHRGAG
jgi:hypothetical protein